MKKTMARFYTDTMQYIGKCYLTSCSFLELRSWLRSGNYLMIHDEVYKEEDIEKLRAKLRIEY